jgi:hypothetical protein
MGIFTLGLGLVFLFVGLLSLRRGRIYAGGRRTRSKMTGKTVRLIAIPQAMVGALAVLVGLADLLGFSVIGQYSDEMIFVLIGTYLVTNLGIGGFMQAKAGEEGVRQGQEG